MSEPESDKLRLLFESSMGWEELKRQFKKDDDEMKRLANRWCKNAGLPRPYPDIAES
jgi:hypothetical protein